MNNSFLNSTENRMTSSVSVSSGHGFPSSWITKYDEDSAWNATSSKAYVNDSVNDSDNSHSNSSSPCTAGIPITDAVNTSRWQDVLAFLGIFLIAAPSTVFNLLVVVLLLISRIFRNQPTYLAMLVLAVADIGHCYVAIYPMGWSILTGDYVPSKQQRFVYFNVIYVFWYTTCIAYGTIALNRFMMMCWPHLNELLFTKRRMLIWIACWPALVALCMLPILTGGCCGFDFTPQLWLLRYEDGREHELNIQLIICYVTSASTTVLGLICYVGIIVKVRLVRRNMNTQSDEYRRMQATDMKLTAQFFILTAIFTFTWVTIHYEASRGPQRSNHFVNYAGLVGYAAMSAMNPFVYFTMNLTLRAAAVRLFVRLSEVRKTGSFQRIFQAWTSTSAGAEVEPQVEQPQTAFLLEEIVI